MRKGLGIVLSLLALPVFAAPVVDLNTNLGVIRIDLNQQKAPETVANFMHYVREGFYNGTIFHRVIAGFVIQGGGYDTHYQKKTTRAPIASESQNGLKNQRGTIAMARTSDPHSATSQFFINLKNNDYLNPGGADAFGYTVFGQVIDGMDVVDKIAALPTGTGGPFAQDVPQTQVVIESVTIESSAPANSSSQESKD